jgi:hypothetical protein
MNNVIIPSTIEKMDRDEFLTFLDTTPSALSMTLKVLGIGITDYGIDYNPQVDSEKWIIEKNARNIHKSNQKQGSVSQTIYKGDPCFEFVKTARDKTNFKTHILDIDMFDGNGSTYPATLSDGMIVITKFMNEDAVIEYDLYYNGDAQEGTVTFDNDGVPTFVANTSL